jgi:CRP-like cAMP-binding protein
MGHLSDQDIEWMSSVGRIVDLTDGETFITEGIETKDIFIITNGAAEVDTYGVGIIAVLRTGEIVGEMSFVDKAPPSATVRARGQLSFLAIDKQIVQARLDQDAGFAGRLYKALAIFMADRLRETTAYIRNGGRASKPGEEGETGELDEMVLDQVSLAGTKFHHMLQTLQRAKRQ